MNTNSNYKNERVLKVLIIIGILAILVSIYIQYLKPFITELSSQKRDQTRIQNLSSINSALIKLQEINPNFFLGEPNKVYISVPSSKLNCEDLELPTLPDGWEYRCKPETEYLKIDGQGWIPIDFTQLPKDFDFESSLPIDPANTADSGYYYAYVVDEKNDWVLTSLLESNKYLKQSALKDGGTDPARFEIGSDLQLWAKASGLVGYWKFDEGQEIKAMDSSGNNNTGTIHGATWVDGKLGKALSFDGENDYVNAGDGASLNITNAITIEAWVKPNIDHSLSIVSKDTYHHDYEFIYRTDLDVFELNYRTPNLYTPESTSFTLNINSWNHFAVSLNCGTKIVSFYVNGKPWGEQSVAECPNNNYNNSLRIGSRIESGVNLNGTIDDVRIYNRGLSAQEVLSIYNATK